MLRYKLTDKNLKTYGNTDWSGKDWKTVNGRGELCGSGWLHCYSTPLLAVLLNPIHAGFSKPRLLKVEVRGECKLGNGIKEGWTQMRRVSEIPLPEVSTESRVRFAILCALRVYKDANFVAWALNWLSYKKNRTQEGANITAYAAARAALAAKHAALAAESAAHAVAHYKALDAAYAAAYAASSAVHAMAHAELMTAVSAARSAGYAASAATSCAAIAARTHVTVNLEHIAKEAIQR